MEDLLCRVAHPDPIKSGAIFLSIQTRRASRDMRNRRNAKVPGGRASPGVKLASEPMLQYWHVLTQI